MDQTDSTQLTSSAILKYHSIKMDEINDTIGHLWNKTYQGTGLLDRLGSRLRI